MAAGLATMTAALQVRCFHVLSATLLSLLGQLLLLLVLLCIEPARDSRDAVTKATKTPTGIGSLFSDAVICRRRRRFSGGWKLHQNCFYVIRVASVTATVANGNQLLQLS